MTQTKAQLIDGKTASIEFDTGSASAPTISFTGDTDTGLYSPGANELAISTNGTGRLFVDSSGNVGLGTSAPQTLLQLGSTVAADQRLSIFSLTSANDDAYGSLEFRHGVQTGNINCKISALRTGGSSGGSLAFFTRTQGDTVNTDGGVERLRIGSSGVVYIAQSTTSLPGAGNTTTGHALRADGIALHSVSGNYALSINRNTTDGTVQRINREGVQVGSISVTTTATAYNTSSDYRLKENVTAITDGITRLQQLKPSRFNFIADPDTTVDGFIAHEVQTIVPEAITGEKDAVDDEGNPQYQGIDQSKIVPLLTAALQEAVAKIESLEARLTAAGI